MKENDVRIPLEVFRQVLQLSYEAFLAGNPQAYRIWDYLARGATTLEGKRLSVNVKPVMIEIEGTE